MTDGPTTTSYDGVELAVPPRLRYTRSPSDVLRALIGLGMVALGILLALGFQDAVLAFEEDLIILINRAPSTVEHLFIGFVQIMALALPIFVVSFLLVRRDWIRLLAVALAAGLSAAAAWAISRYLLDRFVSVALELPALEFDSWVAPAAFPGSVYIAAAVGALTVAIPWMTRRWRRAAWGLLWLFVVLRLIAGTHPPNDLLIVFGIGWAIGSGVLLLFGSPNRSATAGEIVDALRRAAIEPATLKTAAVDARGSVPYFATDAEGNRLFVKALSPDERSADLMFRAYRWARLKNVGDERAFSSLKRTVEHEALVSLKAQRDGVRTPELLAIASAGDDAMILAYRQIDGASLDSVPDDDLTDDVLAGIWDQVSILRRHRKAHRDLRLANVFLGADGRSWIIDFGFSEVAASDRLLDNDVAELVLSCATKVGAERAVRSARTTLGSDAVARAAVRMQPLALSGATRDALKHDKGLLDAVHAQVQEQCGVEEIEFERLERVKPRVLMTTLALGLALYFLIPQLTQVDFGSVLGANWAWAGVAVVFSALTYVGAAMAMTGSVPDRLAVIPTFLVQIGSSFVNRITPVKVGGLATNARYLQKAGVDPAVAVSGIGISSLVTFAVHMAMLFVFAVWTHQSGLAVLHLPSGKTTMFVLLGVFVVAGLLYFLPVGRKIFMEKVWPAIKRSASGIGEVVRSPGRLALMFGGSFVMNMAYIAALYVSVLAFEGDISFAAVAVVFLAGTAIASAAPTPGGIGAVEAALIAALGSFGVPADIAVPAVFLYRIATFWLPILPGWLAFTHLERTGAL